MKSWQIGLAVLTVLTVIGFFIWLGMFSNKKNAGGAPNDPTGVGGEGSSNPGLFITFTNPTSYGVGSDAFTHFEFYLSKSKSDDGSDNKLTNFNVTDVDNLPTGVTLPEGDIGVTGSDNKVKYDKSLIHDLEHEGTYYIGVKVYNNEEKASNVVWGDKGITYDECRDDPSSCWAGGVQGTGGELDYGDTIPDGERCCTTSCTNYSLCSSDNADRNSELNSGVIKNRYCPDAYDPAYLTCGDSKHYCGYCPDVTPNSIGTIFRLKVNGNPCWFSDLVTKEKSNYYSVVTCASGVTGTLFGLDEFTTDDNYPDPDNKFRNLKVNLNDGKGWVKFANSFQSVAAALEVGSDTGRPYWIKEATDGSLQLMCDEQTIMYVEGWSTKYGSVLEGSSSAGDDGIMPTIEIVKQGNGTWNS